MGIGTTRPIAKMASGRGKPAGVFPVWADGGGALPGRDQQRAEDELRALVERVAWRARRRSAMARTLTLKVRYADFETFTRARTFAATDDERRLLAVAVELLRSNWEAGKRIRLLGVGLSHLTPGERQLKLPFGEAAGRGGVARAAPGVAIDAVREKFGYGAIRMGGVGR